VLAHEFMLARGHGRPQVYAAFNFSDRDQSPPSDPNGFIIDTDCVNGWTCTDRFMGVANLVGWHNFVGNAPVANWFDDSVNLIAFSRGDRGWIALNNETTGQSRTYATGLPAGTYCDIIHGDLHNGACIGPTYTVDSLGNLTLSVPAKDAVAFTAANRIGGSQ
jgi:alpha-amylase